MMSEEMQDKVDFINKRMREGLAWLIGEHHDKDDIAIVLANAYLKTQNLKLIDDEVYQGEKNIGKVSEISYDGKKLQLKIKYNEPMHVLALDFEVKDEKSKS